MTLAILSILTVLACLGLPLVGMYRRFRALDDGPGLDGGS